MKLRRTLRLLALMVVLVFFSREIHHHWQQLAAVKLQLHPLWLCASCLLVAAAYFAATLAWRHSLLLATGTCLDLRQAIALVNIAQLAKYLPGKIWFYAIQMHLLADRGCSKATVLSLNAIMLASLAGSATVAGIVVLLLTRAALPPGLTLPLLIAATLAYVSVAASGSWLVDLLLRTANRLFGSQFAMLGIHPRAGLPVHLLYLFSNLLFGVAGYAAVLGIGATPDVSLISPIAGSMLLSDIIGFMAFITPGGIGVREGVMYAMLKPVLDIRLCFMLPIAFRLVTTISDLLLGGLALLFLRKYFSNQATPLDPTRSEIRS
jgi:hypothetical protein